MWLVVRDLGVLTDFGLEIRSCFYLTFHENVSQIRYFDFHC